MGRLSVTDRRAVSNWTDSHELASMYSELVRLRQQVKMAECGRAIWPQRQPPSNDDGIKTLQ